MDTNGTLKESLKPNSFQEKINQDFKYRLIHIGLFWTIDVVSPRYICGNENPLCICRFQYYQFVANSLPDSRPTPL